MEDNLNFLKMEDNLNLGKRRRPQLFVIMEDKIYLRTIEDDLIFLEKEDNLIYQSNGKQSQKNSASDDGGPSGGVGGDV